MMKELGVWLPQATSPVSIRERAAVLAGALEDHGRLEELRLFAPLRDRSDSAHHLVDMMDLVHDEVRTLFGEIEAGKAPKERLWTMLDITETHFVREEQEVFPLAEHLMNAQTLIQLGAAASAE